MRTFQTQRGHWLPGRRHRGSVLGLGYRVAVRAFVAVLAISGLVHTQSLAAVVQPTAQIGASQNGPALAMATVASRALMRGEILSPADLATEPRSLAVARGSVDLDQAIGTATRRAISAGAVLRISDLMKPLIVSRGENVAIEIIEGPMRIAATGRALDNGAAGAVVRVVSAATNKTLQAVVAGPGTVRVGLP